MAARYAKWHVTGHERERWDPDGPAYLGLETVVVITEPRAWEWHLVLDGDAIRDFRMVGLRAPVDAVALNFVPLTDLVRMAKAYITRVQECWDDGYGFQSFEVAELQPGTVSLDRRPTDEDLARAWHEIGPQAPDGTPRRKALGLMFNKSPSTIDVWLKQVRERTDLIPEPTTGRGNRRRPDVPDA